MLRARDLKNRRRAGIAALCLYAAALLTPAHEILAARDPCAECEEAGPAFSAVCDGEGSCADPAHHHHEKPHRHGQCPVCKLGHVPVLAAVRAVTIDAAPDPAGTRASSGAARSLALRDLRSHPARAPPLS